MSIYPTGTIGHVMECSDAEWEQELKKMDMSQMINDRRLTINGPSIPTGTFGIGTAQIQHPVPYGAHTLHIKQSDNGGWAIYYKDKILVATDVEALPGIIISAIAADRMLGK